MGFLSPDMHICKYMETDRLKDLPSVSTFVPTNLLLFTLVPWSNSAPQNGHLTFIFLENQIICVDPRAAYSCNIHLNLKQYIWEWKAFLQHFFSPFLALLYNSRCGFPWSYLPSRLKYLVFHCFTFFLVVYFISNISCHLLAFMLVGMVIYRKERNP